MKLCEYGCEQEAKYYLKFKHVSDKWCCSEYSQNCPVNKIEPWNKGKTNVYSKETLEKFRVAAKNRTKEHRKKLSKANKGKHHSADSKKKISKAMKGESNPFFGKTHSEETRKIISEKIVILNKENYQYKLKQSISKRLTITKINKKYKIFSKIEDLRYNPDKPEEKEIQVHCKYNKCPNSKENGGWFTPSWNQLHERLRNLEQHSLDHSYFYCSRHCKDHCNLFNLRRDPYKETESSYIPGYEIFKQEVLKRQREEHGYNFCEYCETKENLHVHHEKPQKTNILLVLDPDNGVVLCEKCHYIIGHQDECSTGNLANKICL